MICPLCETPVSDTDVACPGCDEMLSEWRIISGNSTLLRQRGLTLAGHQDYIGACFSFMEAALSDPTDGASLVDAGRALLHLGREQDAARVLDYAQQRSRDTGARKLLELIKQRQADSQADADSEQSGAQETLDVNALKDSVNAAPLLGLDLLPRKSLFGTGDVDNVWRSVLHVERKWSNGDCGLNKWLQTACEIPEPHPALVYLCGLDAWKRDSPNEATKSFASVVARETSLLNPAAWLIYATLITGQDPQGPARMVIDKVGTKGLGAVTDALRARLKEFDTDQSREALRGLRNIRT